MSDLMYSAAAERNRGPILEVLSRVLPATGTVLEIASGTGQHVVHFAQALPDLSWQPSDPDPAQRASICARIIETSLPNIREPLDLDVLQDWPQIRIDALHVDPGHVDAVIVANLLHISDAATLPALCNGAKNVLRNGGVLHIYGPFKHHGEHNSSGNMAFDQQLRERNPHWGIRDLEQVEETARECGFVSRETNPMPANNYSLVFELRSA